MKSLSSLEKWKLALTGSFASTVAGQRAAIRRHGLARKSKQEVKSECRQRYQTWLATQPTYYRKLPAWLTWTIYHATTGDRVAPYVSTLGETVNCALLSGLAYGAVDWGQARNHSYGYGRAVPASVEEQRRGSGWNARVRRYAHYLAILSPDRKWVAIQVDAREPIRVYRVYRETMVTDALSCWFRGARLSFARNNHARQCPVSRDFYRLLKRHGFDARLVRQTEDMVSNGSGDSTGNRSHPLYCVVPDGLGGWYHVAASRSRWIGRIGNRIVHEVRTALAERVANHRQTVRNAELDRLLSSCGENIWVRFQDSLDAGNCQAGTSAFLTSLKEKVNATGEIGAVRASVILAIRDDTYTRAACRTAALRYQRSHS